jgi:hypothetical protein
MFELPDFRSDEEEAAVFFAGSICLLLVQGKMVGRNGRSKQQTFGTKEKPWIKQHILIIFYA